MPTIAVDYVWMVSVDKMSQMTITNSFDWKSKAKSTRLMILVCSYCFGCSHCGLFSGSLSKVGFKLQEEVV